MNFPNFSSTAYLKPSSKGTLREFYICILDKRTSIVSMGLLSIAANKVLRQFLEISKKKFALADIYIVEFVTYNKVK